MKTDGILHFTDKEETENRASLVNFISRVSMGQCTTAETSMLPYLVNVMFPDIRGLKIKSATDTNY